MNGGAKILSGAQLLELNPFEVDIRDRIGFMHPDKAIALGRLMAVDGQRDPIKVVRGANNQWRLVTGAHRLMGAREENIPVFAIEVQGQPEDLADLEASENLHRRPLGPIERAKFTAALVQAAQERIAREHGDISHQKLGAKIRWERVKAGEETVEKALADEADDAADKMSAAYGWQESVADALGLDKRTIRRDLALYRLLIEPFPDLIEQLALHPTVGENASQLNVICKVRDHGTRRAVIEALLEDRHMSAEMARIRVGLDGDKVAPPTKDVKFSNTISDSWGRLSITARREYLPRFVSLLSDDMKSRLRTLLDEEGGDAS